jgi:hypothetical protein
MNAKLTGGRRSAEHVGQKYSAGRRGATLHRKNVMSAHYETSALGLSRGGGLLLGRPKEVRRIGRARLNPESRAGRIYN